MQKYYDSWGIRTVALFVAFALVVFAAGCREKPVPKITVPPSSSGGSQAAPANGLEGRQVNANVVSKSAAELKEALKGKQVRVMAYIEREAPASVNNWSTDARLLVSRFLDTTKLDEMAKESKEQQNESAVIALQRPMKSLADSAQVSEAMLLEMDARLNQDLIGAGFQVIDSRMALGNATMDLLKDGKVQQGFDPATLEMASLQKYADVAIQVLVTRDSAAGVVMAAKAISIKDARVLASALVQEKDQALPGMSKPAGEDTPPDLDALWDTMIARLFNQLKASYSAAP
jgi:hypothetical protein